MCVCVSGEYLPTHFIFEIAKLAPSSVANTNNIESPTSKSPEKSAGGVYAPIISPKC